MYKQRATITPETGNATVVIGSGEHDTPMPNGNFSIRTPASASSPRGYKVTVGVDYSTNNGQTWQASTVSQGSCSVMYYTLAIVVSEDQVDQDWNDCVVQFSWWVPPS